MQFCDLTKARFTNWEFSAGCTIHCRFNGFDRRAYNLVISSFENKQGAAAQPFCSWSLGLSVGDQQGGKPEVCLIYLAILRAWEPLFTFHSSHCAIQSVSTTASVQLTATRVTQQNSRKLKRNQTMHLNTTCHRKPTSQGYFFCQGRRTPTTDEICSFLWTDSCSSLATPGPHSSFRSKAPPELLGTWWPIPL